MKIVTVSEKNGTIITIFQQIFVYTELQLLKMKIVTVSEKEENNYSFATIFVYTELQLLKIKIVTVSKRGKIITILPQFLVILNCNF